MSMQKTTLFIAVCSVLLTACAGNNNAERITVKDYQAPVLDAKWVSYQCDAGVDQQQAEARYHFGEATAVAQVKLGEQILTLDYDGERSNAETTVFSVDNYSWSITNKFAGKKPELEENGFLTVRKNETVNGTTIAVEEILKKACFPLK
ncbi:hypothetical protein OA57_06020 [Chelonobacter oris]|uniref:Lipoprotein n=1 Tax=Chelonobacter oris TaxID=505317 RepID=A0A0A3ARJ9_9PAST|nr:hypothetical protein [Chelonobacter oris]KGQ70402.1 hypothetical protein OA57_06020 [Chelonobacter oris]